jgi:hypothetical protein
VIVDAPLGYTDQQMIRSATVRSVSAAFVAALLVWLTTLDCATCCLTDTLGLTEAGCQLNQAPERSCCAAAVACRSAAGDTSSASPAIGGDDAPCPLLPTRYGDSERPSRDHWVAALSAATPVAIRFSSRPDPPLPRDPRRVANRGDTYLRCCVLLI